MQGSRRQLRGPTPSAYPQALQATWCDARRANALARDFTVNALMLDPFSLLLYDYTSGVRDCTKQTLRAIGSPAESFKADPARILRAVRHAARCGERPRSPACTAPSLSKA